MRERGANNDEILMTNDEAMNQMTDDEITAASNVIRVSSLVRHSSFVICHSYNVYQRSTPEPNLVRTVVFTCDRGRDGDHAPPFQKHALQADEGDDGIPGGKMGPAVA